MQLHPTSATTTGICAVALAILLGSGGPAQADDIKFVGQSRASTLLKRDVLVAIAGYAKARHGCGTLTMVESAPMEAGYEPRTPLFRVSQPRHLYERWVVTLCGARRAFLVALWPAAQGGADYKVVEVPPGTEP